jgi:hypothetical protein
MSIKVNHSNETLTPESGILDINSTGALKLPAGNVSARPTDVSPGLIRYVNDTDLANPEYFDGTDWRIIVNKDYVDSQISTADTNLTNTINNLQLNDLTDVTVTGPTTGQVLVYDSTIGQFRSQTNALTPITRNFMGDGTTLEFDIQTSVSNPNMLVVSINGITQEPYYSYNVINGNILSFDEAPETSDRIQVRILRSNTTSDRPRPMITNISYSALGPYTTISIVASDITYGTSAKIGNTNITRIDYPQDNILQLMIETSQCVGPLWNSPQDLTLVDNSGNEYTYKNLINYGSSKPQWINSNSYIGRFRGGDSIDFKLGVNNTTSITISPAYAGESAISWLTISGDSIVGTAPTNSSPSRYEITVTASNGIVDITKNYWLLVV